MSFFPRSLPSVCLVLVVFLLSANSTAQPDAELTVRDTAAAAVAPEAAQRLTVLDQAIADQRKRNEELNSELKRTSDAEDKAALEAQIRETRERINRLRQSLEQIVIGGIDPATLIDDAPRKIDWRAELESLSLPLLATLRELTEKPRRIESLRTRIDQDERRLEVIEQALISITAFEQADLPKTISSRVASIAGEWRSREAEVQQSLEVSRLQLSNLRDQRVSTWDAFVEGLIEFLQGRGLTLFLAVIVGLLTWQLFRGFLRIYEAALAKKSRSVRSTRLRIVEYTYRSITVFVVTISVFAVFYARSDLLLMALSLVVIVSIALGARQLIPRYIRETRLLLDVGPVRERERVVVDGVPYKVVNLNVYTYLKNPLLSGVLRLPLTALDQLASRPDDEEVWFPTEPGDFVFLPDKVLAKVVSQSVDFVELSAFDSRIRIPTADFLKMGVRNISEVGFGIPFTFGIDYQHQAIALDEPPRVFRETILDLIENAGFDSHVQEVLVEFKEAGTSSLDYLVYVNVLGSGAPFAFKIGRLVQQACVKACNEKNWTIPFNQLTVHSGDDGKPPFADTVALTAGDQ